MAAIVLPGAVRYAVHQTLAGRDVVNIVDMHVADQSATGTREDALFAVAGDLINNWSDHVLPSQITQLVAQSVSWVDLDSADGSVGTRSSTSAETWPQAGGVESPIPFPGMVAMRVIKETTGGRRQRRGRMYLAGFDEGKTGTDPNRWLPAMVTQMNTAMGEFLDGMSDDGVVQEFARYPIVIHQDKAGNVSASRVTGYNVDPVLGTQRRRTRG